jgi:large subunit ribosomal protein L32
VAVPKRKMSRSNTRARRSQWKTTQADLVACPSCKSQKLAHQACPTCGAYNGRQYVEALRTEHEA